MPYCGDLTCEHCGPDAPTATSCLGTRATSRPRAAMTTCARTALTRRSWRRPCAWSGLWRRR